jgi:hypothetical protein
MPIAADNPFQLSNLPQTHDDGTKAVRIAAHLDEFNTAVFRVELRVTNTLISTTEAVYATDWMEVTDTECIAEEAGFAAAFTTVITALKEAIATKLDGLAGNAGVTFTVS